MRRGLILLAILAALVAAPTSMPRRGPAPIQVVVDHGLMGPSVAEFKPGQPLTREALGYAMAVLTGKPQVVVDPQHTVTMAQLDRRLVTYLDLRGAAKSFQETVAMRA